MSATDDVARMLTLVPWLLERPGASLAEIATAFGVEVATIRRDLGALDFCGLPGLGGGDLFDVTTVGDRVVVQMADELKRPLKPTPSEALRLVLTVDAMADVAGEEVPALRSAVGKIRAALGIPRTTADVVADAGPLLASTLRDAIRDRVQVEIDYRARGAETATTRLVDPWALHVVDGTWYLQAFDHTRGGRRPVPRPRGAAARRGPPPPARGRPPPPPPPRYVAGPDDVEVVLVVEQGGRWLADAVVLDEQRERPDGRLELHLRTDAPAWLAQLVLMAGGQARVAQPAALRAEVVALARSARARYATSATEAAGAGPTGTDDHAAS
ncbi:MAG: WYL domain-containing protein [Nitriliruptoraceae bacterium]|nr:WYL domain-containing protein [Nitriliruptoraceae bacterium]